MSKIIIGMTERQRQMTDRIVKNEISLHKEMIKYFGEILNETTNDYDRDNAIANIRKHEMILKGLTQ